MAKAIDVANYIVKNFNDKREKINNLKLQKLLYYCEAKSLANCNESLFPENIEKWKLGPVVPEVYHKFKAYGASDITETAKVPVFTDKESWSVNFEVFDENNILVNEKKIINEVIKKYGNFDAFELVRKTHEEPMWREDEDKIKMGIMHLLYDRNQMKEYFVNEWK